MRKRNRFPSPEDVYAQNEFFEKTIDRIKDLKGRDRAILRLIWYEGLNLVELAEKYSICYSRIHQIRCRIFRILKGRLGVRK